MIPVGVAIDPVELGWGVPIPEGLTILLARFAAFGFVLVILAAIMMMVGRTGASLQAIPSTASKPMGIMAKPSRPLSEAGAVVRPWRGSRVP